MYSKLRYIILLTAACWLLCSCASDAPAGEDTAQGAEMQFAISGISRASTT